MPARGRSPLRMGLRLQIVLALAGLMALAFGPLFFAVASLTGATVLGAREESARLVGRLIAIKAAEALSSGDLAALARVLQVDVHMHNVEAVCVFGREGTRLACAGDSDKIANVVRPLPGAEAVRVIRGFSNPAFEVAVPSAEGSVVARIDVEAGAESGTALVRLVAFYTIVFALALLLFAYFVLTRLIVRPIEQLATAADRVAGGARTLRVPSRGARELVDLSTSVHSMTKKLIADESTLLRQVEELTEAAQRLKDTQAQLVRSERLASVGRLAAGIAHEIGNPIAALMGLEDLLLEGDLSPEARDFLRRMRRETDRIHVVVRDLLDFARPEGTAVESNEDQAPADVASVINDVAALVRPQKFFRGVRLETSVAEPLRVALPASRLTQVLLNIVLNAGAAIAGAGRDSGHIAVRARAESSGRIRIEVEDDGPGIPEQVRDRVFEPFVTTKPVGKGTGLGLAVCRGLVESAGGEIGLDGSYTSGARFYVVLPAAAM